MKKYPIYYLLLFRRGASHPNYQFQFITLFDPLRNSENKDFEFIFLPFMGKKNILFEKSVQKHGKNMIKSIDADSFF